MKIELRLIQGDNLPGFDRRENLRHALESQPRLRNLYSARLFMKFLLFF
ncbi:Uncharacterised protein [Paenibacillus macerans]|nr:Uncharacterised protein [Paenibacillus macerans]